MPCIVMKPLSIFGTRTNHCLSKNKFDAFNLNRNDVIYMNVESHLGHVVLFVGFFFLVKACNRT